MRARSSVMLFLLVAALTPLKVNAQEANPVAPVGVASFSATVSRPHPVAMRQSNGEKSVALAVALNALVLPGVGNFYAGNTGHGLRHVGLHLGAGILLIAGLGEAIEGGSDDGEALFVVGGLVLIGNWVWSIVSGIEDARAAGGSEVPGGGATSVLQPQLVRLGTPRGSNDPLTTHRLGLQLLRVTF